MTHVERLWLLCLAYASATATPTTPLVVLLFVTPLVVGDGTCKARLASQVDHNCAIQLADDTLVCWGQNNAGQSTPPSDQFSYVAAGEANSIGILASDGTPRIWGPDGGDGIVNNLPTAVASKAIDIGPWHGCLLRADTHAAQCWGYNRYGQGNPPAPLSTPYSEIHTSKYISCGLREADALIVCWAWGMSSAMAAVSFSTFEIGYNDHMCGLRQANGFAACWRGNTNHDPPVELQSVAFSAVTVGNGHFCALTQADHTARCWGTNDRGQATVPDTSVPYLAITAGHSHTCAVRASDGGVDCWGRNDNGQATVPAGLIACAPPRHCRQRRQAHRCHRHHFPRRCRLRLRPYLLRQRLRLRPRHLSRASTSGARTQSCSWARAWRARSSSGRGRRRTSSRTAQSELRLQHRARRPRRRHLPLHRRLHRRRPHRRLQRRLHHRRPSTTMLPANASSAPSQALAPTRFKKASAHLPVSACLTGLQSRRTVRRSSLATAPTTGFACSISVRCNCWPRL